MHLSLLAFILAAVNAAATAQLHLGPELAFSDAHATQAEDLHLAASDGGHLLAAWRQYAELAVSLDGRKISVPAKAMAIGTASGPNTFLVVWVENENNVPGRILAIRIALDGTVLDPSPIVVATEKLNAVGVAAAHDNSTFLITWVGNGSVRSIRLYDVGVPMGIATDTYGPLIPVSPHVLVTPRGLLNVWTETASNLIDPVISLGLLRPAIYLSPPIQGDSSKPLGAVVRDGTRLWYPPGFGAAATGNSIAFDWIAWDQSTDSSTGCLFLAANAQDGSVLTPMHQILCGSETNDKPVGAPALGWDGNQLTAVWVAQSATNKTVRAVSLGQNGAIEDSFVVASNAQEPAVAPIRSGVAIAYDRQMADGTWRVFVRTLDRIASQPRQRAVRH